MSESSDLVANVEAKAKELDGLRGELRDKFGIAMPAAPAAPASLWSIIRSKGGLVAGSLGLVAALAVIAIAAFFVGGPSYLRSVATAAGWLGTVSLFAASAALIIGCALAWPDRFDRGWSQLDKILSSSGFYFFAGLALLLYAIHTTSSLVHPSLTFLLAMLGMAIMLFGTGSQAVGSIATAGARQLDPAAARERDPNAIAADDPWKQAQDAATATVDAIKTAEGLPTDTEKAASLASLRASAEEAAKRAATAATTFAPAGPSRDWSPFKANAAIAGGAAVLTALFGYGVINYRTEIKDVFGYYDRYVKLRIGACAAFDTTCATAEAATGTGLVPNFTLAEYGVSAELINGAPLYTIKSGDEVQILVFSEAVNQNLPIRLRLWRQTRNDLIGPEVDSEIYLTISPKSFNTVAPPPAVSDTTTTPAAPEICTQFKGTTRVKCALAWVDADNSGEQLHTILYSLNFYRKENAVAEAKVNNVDVSFD